MMCLPVHNRYLPISAATFSPHLARNRRSQFAPRSSNVP